MEKKWILPSKNQIDFQEDFEKLFSLHPKIVEILINRGYNSKEKIEDFLNPRLKDLHSPFKMDDMEKVVLRIEKAIENNEKILIYGDYDVDGTTSVAMLYLFLKKFHSKIIYYLPDRYSEGYGISKTGIDFAISRGVSLIIALDCGTKDFESISYAKKNNLDVIVCDHHQPDDNLPEAFAILNPKKKKCDYPFKELSGCGVGFKLISAISEKKSLHAKEYFCFLDFVAISIACDIVPILGENRVLMDLGLKKISEKPLSVTKNFLAISGKSNFPSVSDIVFGIGPRINAAGRMDHAKIAVKALLSEKGDEQNKAIEHLEILNNSRKEVDKQITEQALSMIEIDKDFEKKSTTVLYNPIWHKGIIGIVASRCIEYFYKPTIILTLSQGKITGSGRSIHGINLYEVLNSCKNLLDRFGGHEFAAGMTLDILNLEKFKKKFDEEVSKKISKSDFSFPQNIDSKIDLSEIYYNLFESINKMAPFGPGNMTPIFASKVNQKVDYQIINNTHLKFSIKIKQGRMISAIAFNMKEKEKILKDSNNFEIAFSVEEDTFLGNKELSLRVRDIKNCY